MRALLRLGDPKAAIDSCIRLNHWERCGESKQLPPELIPRGSRVDWSTCFDDQGTSNQRCHTFRRLDAAVFQALLCHTVPPARAGSAVQNSRLKMPMEEKTLRTREGKGLCEAAFTVLVVDFGGS